MYKRFLWPISEQIRQASAFFVLRIVTLFSLILVPIITFRYSYNAITRGASIVGFLILLGMFAVLCFVGWRTNRQASSTLIERSVTIGIRLGLLWVIEIGINNLLTPPLPARDVIDNCFWASIALGIFVFCLYYAYHTDQFGAGITVGGWSGFASGLLACGTALALVVFGMPLITHDPLNITEWAARRSGAEANTMAAYFAYETFTGAFLHLIVLGVIMGLLLGSAGGLCGKGIKYGRRWTQ